MSLWAGSVTVQCDGHRPIPVAGPAYTQALSGDSTVVRRLGLLAKEDIFPAILGYEQVIGCTETAAVLHKF